MKVTADTITDEQIRERREGDDYRAIERARLSRRTAESRARHTYKVSVDKAFAFFGSTDVEQAARCNAVQRADAALTERLRKIEMRYRARCAEIWNARRGGEL